MSMVRKFAENCQGNMATLFAISAVPLLIGAGVAIDMVQINNANTVLQGAVDAAALAAASSGKTDQAELEEIARKFLKANGLNNAMTQLLKFEVVRDEEAGTINVRIAGERPNSIMHLAGIEMAPVAAQAEVKLPADGLEVALALDVTTSMNADGRLPALKSAANDFVETMMEAEKTGAYVRVGIVPFANYVNVGLSRRNESWIDVPADTSVTLPQQCSIQYPHRTWNNCTEVPKTAMVDGVPQNYISYENCTVVDGPPENVCFTPVSSSIWAGCVGSRPDPLDGEIGKLSTRYPGVPNVPCNAEVLPLGKDKAKLKSKIDSLVADGNTYIPSGLLWGWNMVDGEAPFNEAKSKVEIKAKKGTKAIVLMTDGNNTLSPIYPLHTGTDGKAADKKVDQLCKAIKADEIVIYTISFMVTDTDTIKMLEKCASGKTNAFSADNAAQLTAAFKDISDSMLAMRLSK